jgi:hypothetical protein
MSVHKCPHEVFAKPPEWTKYCEPATGTMGKHDHSTTAGIAFQTGNDDGKFIE